MDDNNTPSKQAKELWCKSLAQVSEISGVPVSTLKDWHYKKPKLFEVVCMGVYLKTKD